MFVRILNTTVQLLFLVSGSTVIIWMFREAYKSAFAQLQVRTYGYVQRQHLRALDRYRTASQRRRGYRPTGTWLVHMEDLIAATLPVQNPYRHAKRFLSYSLYFGAFVYVVAHVIYATWLAPLPLAVPAIFLPYLVLRLIKYRVSIRNSYDIIPAILKLLPEYRNQNSNMRHALPELVKQLPKTPVRRALSRLSNRLEAHNTPEEAKRAVRSFQNECSTNWATLLSRSIERAHVQGLNVETSLERLVTHVTEVQKALADNNLNRVDIMALGFMPAVVLVGGYIFLSVTVSRIAFGMQTHTALGSLYTAVDIGVSIVGIVVSVFFYKPKQDF
ncbi:hypothetical protein [Alicyclobacillus mengziensis]|uniref:Uncharacterized protein n=1 Tax=Alicyclobacillus mengziensis TaxID=2931921 RepID=A0A9X7W3T9_9BACL|nr:hypothetical protein [Alicyclobacillus mengziensis]QSO50139.1 hypothetical protein JZ786_24545 [Alicyclobacillus mengziensis]